MKKINRKEVMVNLGEKMTAAASNTHLYKLIRTRT